jgi:hypothetical protein
VSRQQSRHPPGPASQRAPDPGDIIPEWWATSSRNGGRHYLGMAGGFIPESWAASAGIGTFRTAGAFTDGPAAITRALAGALAPFAKRFLESPPGLKAKVRTQKKRGQRRRPTVQAPARLSHDAQGWPSGGVAPAAGVASGASARSEARLPSTARNHPSAPSALMARRSALPGLGLVKSSTTFSAAIFVRLLPGPNAIFAASCRTALAMASSVSRGADEPGGTAPLATWSRPHSP